MNYCADAIFCLIHEHIARELVPDATLEAYCERLSMPTLARQLQEMYASHTPLRLSASTLLSIKADLQLEGIQWRRVQASIEADMAYSLLKLQGKCTEECERITQEIFEAAMLVTEEQRRRLREDSF